MVAHTSVLWRLAEEVLDNLELEDLRVIAAVRPLNYSLLIDFDRKLGGPGISNVDCFGHGRYAVEDRDIFRPLQYLESYFDMVAEERRAEWLTRELIHISSLHVENLIKRISGTPHLPLGAALRERIVQTKLDAQLLSRISKLTRIYNDSKHNVSHPKDTHLFSIEDTIVAYAVCRKFAEVLYPYVKLTTDLAIFEQRCEDCTQAGRRSRPRQGLDTACPIIGGIDIYDTGSARNS